MLAVQSIWQRPGHRNEERGRVRQTLPGTEPLAQHPEPTEHQTKAAVGIGLSVFAALR